MGAQGVPRGTKILGRARRRSSRVAVREIREPSRSLRLQVHVLEASSERQIKIAFETLKQKPVGALLLANDTFLSGRRELLPIVELLSYVLRCSPTFTLAFCFERRAGLSRLPNCELVRRLNLKS
jgi:hypothetical protein